MNADISIPDIDESRRGSGISFAGTPYAAARIAGLRPGSKTDSEASLQKQSRYSLGHLNGLILALVAFTLIGCQKSSEKTASADSQQHASKHQTPWDRVAAEASPADANLLALLAERYPALESNKDATMPILLPADPDFIRRMNLNVKSHLYTAVANYPDHRVQITAIHSGKPDGEKPSSTSEDQLDLTFSRWGTTYRLMIKSSDPTRIKDSEIIQNLRRSLVWIKPS